MIFPKPVKSAQIYQGVNRLTTVKMKRLVPCPGKRLVNLALNLFCTYDPQIRYNVAAATTKALLRCTSFAPCDRRYCCCFRSRTSIDVLGSLTQLTQPASGFWMNNLVQRLGEQPGLLLCHDFDISTWLYPRENGEDWWIWKLWRTSHLKFWQCSSGLLRFGEESGFRSFGWWYTVVSMLLADT